MTGWVAGASLLPSPGVKWRLEEDEAPAPLVFGECIVGGGNRVQRP